MAYAKKNYKGKYYRVTLKIQGKQIPFYGESKKDAEGKRDEYKKLLDSGVDPKLATMTLGVAMKDWLGAYGKLDLKVSSQERYDAIFKNHIKDSWIALVEVNSLARISLQKYFNESDYTHGQVDAIVKLISKFYHFAVSDGYANRNPCTGFKNPKPMEEQPIEVFTPEEIKRLVMVDNRHTCQIKLMLYTGMRLGEALALTWEDIDFEARTIKVTKSIDAKGRLTTPKTKGSIRLFVFPDHMEADLRKKKLANKEESMMNGSRHDIVFPSTVGTYLIQKNFRLQYADVLKEAGVKYRPPHTLRHTFTTSAKQMGIPIEDIAQMLGHSSMKTTREVYLHYGAEDLRKLVNDMYKG